MKLVEILARELKEWPATTACFAQDDDGDIYNYVSTCIVRDRGEWEGVDDAYLDHSFDCLELYGQDLAFDHDTAIVTRKMWENERAKMNEWKNGLPPVGTICEYRKNPDEWLVGNVFGHRLCSNGEINVFVNLKNSWDYSSDTTRFRPIKTPEQIAKEEREAALKDMKSIVMGSSLNHGMLESLYDAGYRKTGDSK